MYSDDELSPEEKALLEQAISNLQGFIKDNTTLYALIDDPRNEEDYDTFEYGTEPLPGDRTWVDSEEDCPQG